VPYKQETSSEGQLLKMGDLGILDRASIATSPVVEPSLPVSQGRYEHLVRSKLTVTPGNDDESKERERQRLQVVWASEGLEMRQCCRVFKGRLDDVGAW
jgi:hypothetical protein